MQIPLNLSNGSNLPSLANYPGLLQKKSIALNLLLKSICLVFKPIFNESGKVLSHFQEINIINSAHGGWISRNICPDMKPIEQLSYVQREDISANDELVITIYLKHE